jgi:type IV pilus assembly protein PilY1
MKKTNFPETKKRLWLGTAAGLLFSSVTHFAHAEPSQVPLFLTAPVKPIVMLNMSKDHQLFFKAYDDYSDLDPENEDGPETTFKPSYPYYGYFDYQKCYVYSSDVFEPAGFAVGGRCNIGATTDQWSGNFLNWATMTRIDAVRKVLYGGKRFEDKAGSTILERALIPEDAHAFAKYYNGTDLGDFAPFPTHKVGEESNDSGITICNATSPTENRGASEAVTSAPLMKVASGNYSLWASSEGWQCRWGVGSSDNDPAITGINAHVSSPEESDKLGDWNVRVKVCTSTDLINETNDENCRPYASGKYKPAGVLQEYGEDGAIRFGLLTGSYGKNKSGGVLRKNVGDMTDEIDLSDGTVVTETPTGGSIIRALDALTIVGYDYSNGQYNASDNCPWAISSFNNGACRNWGNPQSEIYLESLRYLSGQGSATEDFSVAGADVLADLISPTWVKPVTNANYCAPLNVIQFNASVSSYDGDELSGASALGINYTTATNTVGSLEKLSGSYFIGSNGTDNNQICTPKAFTSLADMAGTCPDAPRLDGTYHIAGLAYHARTDGIPLADTGNKTQIVQTFGVALAPAIPKVEVPVPGSTTGKTITIMPACRNTTPTPSANCAIVDFKIIEQKTVDGVTQGSLYVNWEDSEQGGDYDQDMWGIIKYEVSDTEAVVSTQMVAMSASHILGFGYVISGTTEDGFHVMSGINGFVYEDSEYCTTAAPCACRDAHTGSSFGRCTHASAALRSKTHEIGPSTADTLEQPLYYAAKWGGYPKTLEEQAEKENKSLNTLIKDRDVSDSYFYATNPRVLQDSLKSAFGRVAAQVGSASTAATSTSRLTAGSRVYQAKFDSTNWDGTVQVLEYVDGKLEVSTALTTDKQFIGSLNPTNRKVLTNTEGELVEFLWDNLSDAQQAALNKANAGLNCGPQGCAPGTPGAGDGKGANRVNWVRGANEPGMRQRTNFLGDIVNSSPVYAGKKTPRYELLPGKAGEDYRALAEGSGVIYVGANDGMLHAFDADTLTEIFAFIPNAAYSKLAALTSTDYGSETNPHQFIVDGSLYVSDVYIGGKWKKYLVGSMGAGGRTIFGLDVTTPSAPELLFEFSSADHPNYHNLGYVMADPVIAPFGADKWYAIFGNGSEGGLSSLFVVDLASPTAPVIVSASEGAGMTSFALLPGLTGAIERIYAGDLSGNIWRFDTAGSPASWGVKHRVYKVTDAHGNTQPITGGITLGANSYLKGHIMVYFGTGKYFDGGDNTASPTPVQSVYAIADGTTGLTGERGDLFHEKTYTQAVSGNRTILNERVSENGVMSHAVDWTTKRGWFMDFKTAGERVVVKPTLMSDRLMFTTLVPSAVACDYGGMSWSMELIAVGDKNVQHSILEEAANTLTEEMVVSDTTVLIESPEEGKQLSCSISGECKLIDMAFATGFRGRMNWREVQ